MKIRQTVAINTGGGTMVLELPVENGGKLKSIVISDDCICGYSHPHPFSYDGSVLDFWLWTADDFEKLVDIIGYNDARSVYHLYKEDWPWSPAAIGQSFMQAMDALIDLAEAAKRLSAAWEAESYIQILDSGYSFNESFEEIASKINDWETAVSKKLK